MDVHRFKEKFTRMVEVESLIDNLKYERLKLIKEVGSTKNIHDYNHLIRQAYTYIYKKSYTGIDQCENESLNNDIRELYLSMIEKNCTMAFEYYEHNTVLDNNIRKKAFEVIIKHPDKVLTLITWDKLNMREIKIAHDIYWGDWLDEYKKSVKSLYNYICNFHFCLNRTEQEYIVKRFTTKINNTKIRKIKILKERNYLKFDSDLQEKIDAIVISIMLEK